MRAKDGPFRCDNCEYWEIENTSCRQANVIKIASVKNKYGLSLNVHGHAAPLNAGDCSDFFDKRK